MFVAEGSFRVFIFKNYSARPPGCTPIPENVQTVFAVAQSMNLDMIPVTSPFSPVMVQEIIRTVIATDNRGVMFRLTVNFFNSPQNVLGYLNGLMTALNVTADRVDILVDLGYRPTIADVQGNRNLLSR